MPVQYYLPRNELTYRYRYTKHNVAFIHYVKKAPNFIVCCIAAIIDLQPTNWECHTLIDFLIILIEGASQKGWGITAFFKEESALGTLPEIVELVHYAYCLYGPCQLDLVTLKTHVRLFQHTSFIQYVNFLKERWVTFRLEKLERVSLLFKDV